MATRLNRTIKTTVDIHFPRAGVDRSRAFSRQPARDIGDGQYTRTAVEAVNVRGVCPGSERLRGGGRAGTSKWIATRGSGSLKWVVQSLNVLVGSGYDPPGGGTVQGSLSGRVVSVVKVQQGNVYSAVPGDTAWTAATNNTGETPPLNATGILFGADNVQKMWFCDGTNYCVFDPKRNRVDAWESTVAGVPLPADEDNNKARLVETYRGRTCLSGIIGKPQGVFMSRIDVPTDFDYFDPVDPTGPVANRAVALETGKQGEVGDMVTCLFAYSDDVLVIGADHKVFLFRGDPRDGGRRDLVTDAVGMAWGRPICRTPSGLCYFFSNRTGIWSMAIGDKPQHVSRPISSILSAINTGRNAIHLQWEDRYKAVRVFVTPTAAAAATRHYVFETETGAWWPDEFANHNHDPLCSCVLDGNEPDDRTVLLGCWDGYVRQVDDDADTDDGEPIESRVLIGPLLTREMDELVVEQLQAVLGEAQEGFDDPEVEIALLVGRTPEAALQSEPVPVGTFGPGLSQTFPVRAAGKAVYLELTSTSRWALEQVRVQFAATGLVRMRGGGGER